MGGFVYREERVPLKKKPVLFVGHTPMEKSKGFIRKTIREADKIVRIKIGVDDTLANVHYFMSTGCNLYLQTATPELASTVLSELESQASKEGYQIEAVL